jgi:hypothetical protein
MVAAAVSRHAAMAEGDYVQMWRLSACTTALLVLPLLQLSVRVRCEGLCWWRFVS